MSIPADQKQREFESEALVHLDALYGLALRLSGGDEPRAEDLVQEAVLKAYRAWDRFETGTNCRAWLMTILRNTFINQFRQQKTRPTPVEFEQVAERPSSDALYEADPEGEIFDRIIDDQVIAAIDELPDEFRVAVVLSDLATGGQSRRPLHRKSAGIRRDLSMRRFGPMRSHWRLPESHHSP